MKETRSHMQELLRTVPALALTLITATVARADCPRYGCEGKLTPLSSGGYVVEATAVFPLERGEHEPGGCLTPGNFLVLKDGQVLQKIPVSWMRRDYFCCCPSDWAGTAADLLVPVIDPGARLTLVLGEQHLCSVEIVAPVIPAVGSPCDDAVPTTSDPHAADR